MAGALELAPHVGDERIRRQRLRLPDHDVADRHGHRVGECDCLAHGSAPRSIIGRTWQSAYVHPTQIAVDQSSAPRSIITEVALTTAVALTPVARPSSSTESRVIAAVTRNGPASISTSAITPSDSTERTVPANRLRADSGAPVWWRLGRRASRSTSAVETNLRPRASRRVRSLPARSQRRSVSWLTPIARAASLIGTNGICLSIA